MRVLLADKLAVEVPGQLEDLGAEVVSEPSLKGDALTARLSELEPHVLVVRSTKVTEADVAAAPALALIIRAGAGVNTIALDEASARGVYVANCPGKNASAVAELAIGHLINVDRRIADNVAALRAGKWDKKGFAGARGLRGRTLAVIGVGRIGAEVISLAKAMGMEVRAWSRSLTPDKAAALGVTHTGSIVQAVTGAHAVSIHLALTDETRGCIDASVFEAMAPGAYFVNVARAEVVDQDALTRAIDEKDLRAGLDVFAGEPSAKTGRFDDPLGKHPNVYGTHHIGASTVQAEEAVGDEVVRIVAAYAQGRPIPNCMNLADQTQASHLVVVRHADRVGVLAGVLGRLGEAGHNVQDMRNIVFSGSKAACARIAIVGAPTDETLESIRADDAVYAVTVTPVAAG